MEMMAFLARISLVPVGVLMTILTPLLVRSVARTLLLRNTSSS